MEFRRTRRKATAITHVFATGGKHVITIKGYLNGKESQGVDIKVDLVEVEITRQQQTSSEPTKPSTTQPTTTKPATTTKPIIRESNNRAYFYNR